jgi:hypothetical protein
MKYWIPAVVVFVCIFALYNPERDKILTANEEVPIMSDGVSRASQVLPPPTVVPQQPNVLGDEKKLNQQTITREALFEKFKAPAYYDENSSAWAKAAEQEVRDYLSNLSTDDRHSAYQLFPPSVLMRIKDVIYADYNSTRPLSPGGIVLAMRRMGDPSVGELILQDIAKIITDAEESKNESKIGHLTNLAQTISQINDANQMDRFATYITKAPPHVQDQLILGVSQSSQDPADFYFLFELSALIPKAKTGAGEILRRVQYRCKLLRECIQYGLKVPKGDSRGDIPDDPSERVRVLNELSIELKNMTAILND